jgi:YqaJ-like viral recombinase domain
MDPCIETFELAASHKELREASQTSDLWRSGRRYRITASIVPHVLGVTNPYNKNSKSVVEDKCRVGPSIPPSAAQARGLANEASIVAEFMAVMAAAGSPVARADETGLWVHPSSPWLAASPDRIITLENGQVGLLEVKDLRSDPGESLPCYIALQASRLHEVYASLRHYLFST